MPGLSPALRKLGGSRGQPRMAVPPKRLRVGIQGPLRDHGGFGGRARRSGRIHQSHGFAGYFVSGQARVYDVAELSGAADTFSSQQSESRRGSEARSQFQMRDGGLISC
jgi:hypothetical protein